MVRDKQLEKERIKKEEEEKEAKEIETAKNSVFNYE